MTARRNMIRLSCVALTLLLLGCAPTPPKDAPPHIGDQGVSEKDRFRMRHYDLLDPRVGVTRRDDVTRLLGDPEGIVTDGSAMVHHWMAYDTGTPEIKFESDRTASHGRLRWYFFLTSFDDAGILRRFEVQSSPDGGRSPQQVLAEWSARPATRP